MNSLNNTQKDQELAELAGKITRMLNDGVAQMDDRTSAKLLAARKEALAHFVDHPKHSVMPEWAVAGLGRITHPFGSRLSTSLLILAMVATLAGAIAWHHVTTPQGSEISEIDEGLLTDELPISAYLDKGFDSWVKRNTRQ